MSHSGMDEYSESSFANRDDSLSIASKDLDGGASGDEGEVDAESQDGKRKGLKSNIKDGFRKATGKTSETGFSVQDRLLEKYA
jgi:hypothetical protein